MSTPDLEKIARDIANAARPGEQLEAYVVRSRETEVKVFNGAVDSLSVAEAAGIECASSPTVAKESRPRGRSTQM